jgi:transcriptional regulator with XRE-family HTH domain
MVSAQATPEGGRLRERRLEAGITQQQLAERARCSIALVRLFESGYQPGHSNVLPRIVAVLESDTTSPASEVASKTRPVGSADDVTD